MHAPARSICASGKANQSTNTQSVCRSLTHTTRGQAWAASRQPRVPPEHPAARPPWLRRRTAPLQHRRGRHAPGRTPLGRTPTTQRTTAARRRRLRLRFAALPAVRSGEAAASRHGGTAREAGGARAAAGAGVAAVPPAVVRVRRTTPGQRQATMPAVTARPGWTLPTMLGHRGQVEPRSRRRLWRRARSRPLRRRHRTPQPRS